MNKIRINSYYMNYLNWAFFAFSFLVFILGISACLESKTKPEKSEISLLSIVNSEVSPSEKAEKLALAAEDLMNGMGFEEAHRTADLALKQDSKNFRAAFIKHMTAPMIPLKGFSYRLRGLFINNPDALKDYDAKLEKSKEQDSPMNKYFTDTLSKQAEIQSVSQLQLEFDKIYDSLDELRLFVKENKDKEITIKASTTLIPDLVERYSRACEIKESEEMVYQLICPSPEVRFQVSFNRADFDMLQDVLSYFELILATLNAYDLSGLPELSSERNKKEFTEKEFFTALLSNPQFGILRKQAKLKEVKNLGMDLLNGLVWARNHQEELCPKLTTAYNNRIGMWFNQGLCLNVYFDPYIGDFKKLVSGEAMESKFPKDSNSETSNDYYVTQQKIMRFYENPIKDFRDLGPFGYNSCEQLESLGDDTLNGVFPNADYSKILKLQNLVKNKINKDDGKVICEKYK